VPLRAPRRRRQPPETLSDLGAEVDTLRHHVHELVILLRVLVVLAAGNIGGHVVDALLGG